MEPSLCTYARQIDFGRVVYDNISAEAHAHHEHRDSSNVVQGTLIARLGGLFARDEPCPLCELFRFNATQNDRSYRSNTFNPDEPAGDWERDTHELRSFSLLRDAPIVDTSLYQLRSTLMMCSSLSQHPKVSSKKADCIEVSFI
jgi:hypothetical protein